MKVDELLFSENIVPNRLSLAWEALEEAVVDTRLVALLHQDGSSGLRNGVGELVERMKQMLESNVALGARQDPRARRWQDRIVEWESSLLLTEKEFLAADDNVLLKRLERSKKAIEALVEDRVARTVSGPGPVLSPLAAEELLFQANIGGSSLRHTLYFQREGAKRAARQLKELPVVVASKQRSNVALSAIRKRERELGAQD